MRTVAMRRVKPSAALVPEHLHIIVQINLNGNAGGGFLYAGSGRRAAKNKCFQHPGDSHAKQND
jgi:hypothetical protein